ncbi:MAG: hypothetical protein ACREK8_07970, partial [Gemmatimonadales bacterium]
LWLPIVVSAIAVFVLSSLVHMILPWHKHDYRTLPDQDLVMDALRPFNIPPADYMVPRPASMADMKSPEFAAKRARGPVMIMTVLPSVATPGMGKYLSQWFVYILIVSAIVACVTFAAAGTAPSDHRIFHFAAFTTLIAYVVGAWPASIWLGRSWGTTFRATVDGVLYAIASGLIFTWMWPK